MKRLQVGQAEVEVRPEQDQRPQGGCDNRREHLGEAAQLGVVGVLGGHDHADHDVDDGGQAGHPMRFAGRRRPPPVCALSEPGYGHLGASARAARGIGC